MGDSDSEDEEMEDTPAEREEKMRNLVPALPTEEWGRKAPITPAKKDDKDARPVKKVTIADPKSKSKTVDDKPIKMRPPLFEPQEYDGVVEESDDSDDDDEPARAGSLGKILGDMKWADMGPQIEGLDGEDEEDLEKEARNRSRKFGLGDDIDEAMKRKVWGNKDGPDDDMDEEEDEDEDMDFEPDMEAEQGDFFKFAQEALGLSAEQMQSIVSSREARGGKFIPHPEDTFNKRPDGCSIRTDAFFLIRSQDRRDRGTDPSGQNDKTSTRVQYAHSTFCSIFCSRGSQHESRLI